MSSARVLLDRLVERCTFPDPGTPVVCALSGGPDSSALVALAAHVGLDVTAVHVHHGLRDSADADAAAARRIAGALDVEFRSEHVDLDDGSNLEDRARRARQRVLGPDALTGHTADDQAETLLLALIRGSGARGLAAMRPGPTHPLLALRRADTVAVCDALALEPAIDPTNSDPRFRRNRVRHDVLPLLDRLAERDLAPILSRTASLLRDDDDLLDELAAALDPADARALAAAPLPLARRSLRAWLSLDGYPPTVAEIDRVLDVARGDAEACEISGRRRISRSGQRLSLFQNPV
jgi:tRNA(Ile)-lysidine synthase